MKPPHKFSVLVLEIGSEAAGALARSGFDVSTGQEALQSIRQRPFDLVLLDMSIPGWNGLEACRRIRELVPSTKIIMIAASDADEDRTRAIAACADDCVNHPVHLRERARATLRLSSPKTAGGPIKSHRGEIQDQLTFTTQLRERRDLAENNATTVVARIAVDGEERCST